MGLMIPAVNQIYYTIILNYEKYNYVSTVSGLPCYRVQPARIKN
jgi:hypothetical protein